jgi:hypothetical protein
MTQFILNNIKSLVNGFLIVFALIARKMAFKAGKESVSINENKEVVSDVEKFNKTKQENARLSESDLDKFVPKWTRRDKTK